jgi:uncharacterized protein YndB with AHSA1/START domain
MIADPAAFENLNVQRVIRAPRERVFRAWTNPDDILKWFGPGDCRALDARVDLTIGGSYRFRVLTHGMEMDLVGVFHEIAVPARLVYTWQFKGARRPTCRRRSSRWTFSKEILPRKSGSNTKSSRRPKSVINTGWAGKVVSTSCRRSSSEAHLRDDAGVCDGTGVPPFFIHKVIPGRDTAKCPMPLRDWPAH